MSTIETEKDELIANWIFSCYCMMTSASDVINTTALFFLKQELLKQCNEMECTLPIIDEKIVDDGVNQFKLHTEIEGDDYYISLARTSKKRGYTSSNISKDYDKQEIYINRDCKNAYVVNTMGNNENCYIYKKEEYGYNYRAVLLENLTTGTEKPTESQLALLNDVYEVFGVDGVLYQRVMIPYESDHENGCFANEYGCIDLEHKYLSFSKGNVYIKCTDIKPNSDHEEELNIIVTDYVAFVMTKGFFEDHNFSDETMKFARKIAKVFKKHNIDISNLPAELTDPIEK